jgi:hypothetical protein
MRAEKGYFTNSMWLNTQKHKQNWPPLSALVGPRSSRWPGTPSSPRKLGRATTSSAVGSSPRSIRAVRFEPEAAARPLPSKASRSPKRKSATPSRTPQTKRSNKSGSAPSRPRSSRSSSTSTTFAASTAKRRPRSPRCSTAPSTRPTGRCPNPSPKTFATAS